MVLALSSGAVTEKLPSDVQSVFQFWGRDLFHFTLRDVGIQFMVFAVLSARVGSIGDNRLGGWHSYRASKAALNSVLKDVSLVWAGKAICVALHPGWVRTDMGGAGADIDVQTSAARPLSCAAGNWWLLSQAAACGAISACT